MWDTCIVKNAVTSTKSSRYQLTHAVLNADLVIQLTTADSKCVNCEKAGVEDANHATLDPKCPTLLKLVEKKKKSQETHFNLRRPTVDHHWNLQLVVLRGSVGAHHWLWSWQFFQTWLRLRGFPDLREKYIWNPKNLWFSCKKIRFSPFQLFSGGKTRNHVCFLSETWMEAEKNEAERIQVAAQQKGEPWERSRRWCKCYG